MKTSARLHIDQTMRTRNFRVRNEVVERGAVTKSQKGKKAYVERKVGERIQEKAEGQCSKGDSCSFSHDRASGNRCDLRRGGQSLSLAPKAQVGSGRRRESPSGSRTRIPCRRSFGRECTNPSCNYWHPPVYLNHKSETGCIHGKKCYFRHVEAEPC